MRNRSSRNLANANPWQKLWLSLSSTGCYAFTSDYELIQRLLRIERDVDPVEYFMIKMEFERRNPVLGLQEAVTVLIEALFFLFLALLIYLQFFSPAGTKSVPEGIMPKIFVVCMLAIYSMRRFHKSLMARMRDPNPPGFSVPKRDPIYSLNRIDSLYLYPRLVEIRNSGAEPVEGLWSYYKTDRFQNAALRDPLLMVFVASLFGTGLLVEWKLGQIRGHGGNEASLYDKIGYYGSPLVLIAGSRAWLKRRKSVAVDHRTVGIAGQEYRRLKNSGQGPTKISK